MSITFNEREENSLYNNVFSMSPHSSKHGIPINVGVVKYEFST